MRMLHEMTLCLKYLIGKIVYNVKKTPCNGLKKNWDDLNQFDFSERTCLATLECYIAYQNNYNI